MDQSDFFYTSFCNTFNCTGPEFQINHLDDEMMQILSQRMKVAEKIAEYKKENNITILQTNRWNEILDRACKRAEKLGLSKEFITKYFDAVHMV